VPADDGQIDDFLEVEARKRRAPHGLGRGSPAL